jgi:hypothetical protein
VAIKRFSKSVITRSSNYGFMSGRIIQQAIGQGGVITQLGGFTIHTFSAGSSTLTVPVGITLEYLIVAGGGAGGFASTSNYNPSGGGGGGGGYLTGSIGIVGGVNYSIVVGSGGTGTSGAGNNGGNSSAFSLTSIGGGRGGARGSSGPAAGGSGGGGCGGSGAAGTAGQGNRGGNGWSPTAHCGGGAGAAGEDLASGLYYHNNLLTPGLSNSISGSSIEYAKGGRASGWYQGDATDGGNGANDGSGNGGTGRRSGSTSIGNRGDHGTVIVRYAGTVVGYE